MTIEKFITKHCSYGMHISEPCDRKLILNSLYGRKATQKDIPGKKGYGLWEKEAHLKTALFALQ